MAYAHSKLQVLSQTMDGTHNEWVYRSADAVATVKAAGYISDAAVGTAGPVGTVAKGMRIGDLVHIIVVNGSDVVTARGLYWVSALNAATGAATVGGLVSDT